MSLLFNGSDTFYRIKRKNYSTVTNVSGVVSNLSFHKRTEILSLNGGRGIHIV